jgi:tripartite-type tricarboxylate transporter receptor subunit TctC
MMNNLLVVSLSVPAKSVRELIDVARARPGKLSYASPGIGSTPHLAGELFKSMAGVDMVHVADKGAAQYLLPPTSAANATNGQKRSRQQTSASNK